MYPIILILHSYTRWLVLAAVFYGLYLAWKGFLSKGEWTKTNDVSALVFVWAITIQFVLGITLYFYPLGLAQTALQIMGQDFDSAMKVRDLRFFGMEHPLQMVIALIISHVGSARARKVRPAVKQFRWAVISFTLVAILVLSAIPWWRPLLRMF